MTHSSMPWLCGDPECALCGAFGFGRRIIHVYCPEKREFVDESEVHPTNIEEDIQGRDVLTFDCPRCGHSHKSLRTG